jgi:tetratricopeptide (TPR) repeat protein
MDTEHIAVASQTYRRRLAHMSSTLGNRCYETFDPGFEARLRSGEFFECGRILGLEESKQWSPQEVRDYVHLEHLANHIDWIVDQLLGAADVQDRQSFAEVPVRITDDNTLRAVCTSDNDVTWITVDRHLVHFYEHLSRALYLEFFRPQAEDFLYNPPSHEEVLSMLQRAGRLFHRGEWSAVVRPISKAHFCKTININATEAKIGALLFLIAHELGHIAYRHFDLLATVLRSLDGGCFSFAWGEEFQADAYGADLALSAIAHLLPQKKDRTRCEFGIFVFLTSLAVMEHCVLKDLGGDYQRFQRTYGRTHMPAFKRIHHIVESTSDVLGDSTKSLVLELLDLGQTITHELDALPQDTAPDEATNPNRRRFFELRCDFQGGRDLSLDNDLATVMSLAQAGRHIEALAYLDGLNRYSRPDMWHMRGSILTQMGKDEEAIKAYRKAIRGARRAEPWADIAGCYYRTGEYKRCLACARKATSISGTDALGWDWMAVALQALGRADQALEILNSGLEQSRGDTRLLRRKASILAHCGYAYDAVPLVEEVVAKEPTNSAAWHSLGLYRNDCYLRSGDRHMLDKAVEAYRQACDLSPDSADSWRLLGLTLALVGSTEAEPVLVRALEKSPGDEEATIVLSALYLRDDRLGEALALLERALRIHPDSKKLLRARDGAATVRLINKPGQTI